MHSLPRSITISLRRHHPASAASYQLPIDIPINTIFLNRSRIVQWYLQGGATMHPKLRYDFLAHESQPRKGHFDWFHCFPYVLRILSPNSPNRILYHAYRMGQIPLKTLIVRDLELIKCISLNPSDPSQLLSLLVPVQPFLRDLRSWRTHTDLSATSRHL